MSRLIFPLLSDDVNLIPTNQLTELIHIRNHQNSRYVDQINSCVLSRVKDTTPILNSLPRAYMFVAFSDIAIFHFNIAIISDDFFLSDLELGGVRIKDFDSNSLYYLKKKLLKDPKLKIKKIWADIFEHQSNVTFNINLLFLFCKLLKMRYS